MNATAPTLDLIAVKAKQQETWSTGDYAVIAARIALVAERLAEAADLRAGSRVLDVATGSGNAAIAAARSGSEVIGVDYVPALLERARRRADAEGLEVTFLDGDAESLPFPDASFDAVLSVFGAMFAPDQERTAAELLRVTRPGGTVALANWTPDGFIGGLFRTVGRHVPPPAGLRSPIEWGTEPRLQELLGGGVARLDVQERAFTFRFRSAEEFVDLFRTWYGPTAKAFAALERAGQVALADELTALARSHDRLGDGAGAVAIPATYVEAIATKG
jgi:SAM-dependent methyltransferase